MGCRTGSLCRTSNIYLVTWSNFCILSIRRAADCSTRSRHDHILDHVFRLPVVPLDHHIVLPTISLLPCVLFSLVGCLVFDILSLPYQCLDVSIFSFLPSPVTSLLLPLVCEGLTPPGNLLSPLLLFSPPPLVYSIFPLLISILFPPDVLLSYLIVIKFFCIPS